MNWRRSSWCESGSCAEVAWTRSTYCDCAEVAVKPDQVLVRNSQRPDVVVEFDVDEWTAFIHGAQMGEFDAQ